jgi:CRP-like cAMP-binding protein
MSKKPAATWRMTDALAAKLRSFEGKVRLRRFAEGEQLYRQDEVNTCFYFVKSGLVQVSIFRRDGTEVVLENMGPNALCGEGAAFDGLPRFSSAVAVEPTEALEFDTARLEVLMREDPEFALALLRLTSLKQRILALRLEHLVSNDPEAHSRIAQPIEQDVRRRSRTRPEDSDASHARTDCIDDRDLPCDRDPDAWPVA